MGSETSATRVLLLDTTERVMVEDGYAAVSSRRIAKDAGVTAALVHYYFGTLDDLFLAVVRRRAEQGLERQARLLGSPQPLHALWRMSAEPAGNALLMELMALSNHRKVIRAEVAAHAEAFRKAQLQALRGHLEASGIDPKTLDPAVVMVLIAGLSRTIAMEQSLGMKTGLTETVAVIERLLDRYEGPAATRPRSNRAPARKKPGA
jgi:AcrR family transcriptional regulator